MANENYFRQAAADVGSVLDEKQVATDVIRGLVGNSVGVVTFPYLLNHVYVRLQGDASRLVPALNPGYVLVANRPVDVVKKYDALHVLRYVIIGYNTDVQYPDDDLTGYVKLHAHSHMIDGTGTGGFDAVHVFERAITTLRVNAQLTPDMTVRIMPGYYRVDADNEYFAGLDISDTFSAPVSGVQYDVVCLDVDGNITIEASALIYPPYALTLSSPTLIPLAAITLNAGQTTINEWDIVDLRPFLAIASGTGGGSTHWEPVTNGDPDFPEIVFSDGDVVMVEVED